MLRSLAENNKSAKNGITVYCLNSDMRPNEVKEFDACTKAVHNWSDEILNSFDCVYTNGFTEGCNNKIKVIKRVSFGVSNFDYFRNRILHCASLT